MVENENHLDETSILNSIKKLLGIEEEYEHFDQDVIMHTNTAFMHLNQLGLGSEEGFSITSKEDTWSGILGNRKDLACIKTYVFLKVRLFFDPPQMSYYVDAIKEHCKEIEWRLVVQLEGGNS